MATRIQSLFLVRASFEVSNGEDWAADAIAFYEADGITPIPLDGIVFRSIARQSRSSNAPYLGLASPDASLSLPPSIPRGLILTGGNVMAFYVPFTQLPVRALPGSFIGDVLAYADGLTKRVVEYDLTLIQGLTR